MTGRFSTTAVKGRSLRRGKRRNRTSPPCRRHAPWLYPLPLRPRHRSATAMRQSLTLPPSWRKPMGLLATHPRRRRAGASARMSSAPPAPAARCRSTCITQSGCAMAAAGSATGLCNNRTWNCPWTWPPCTISSTSFARSPWRRLSPTASAPMSRRRSGALLVWREFWWTVEKLPWLNVHLGCVETETLRACGWCFTFQKLMGVCLLKEA